MENLDQSVYIPFTWSVTPSEAGAGTYPSPSAILGSFAAINFVVAVASIFLGHRRVVERISCANALVALAIKRTSGYGSGFSVKDLTLFYTARPRIGWILNIPFSLIKRNFRHRRGAQHPLNDPRQAIDMGHYQSSSPYQGRDTPQDYPWRCFAISQFFSEICLQLTASYNMGRTVVFASRRGYYVLGNLPPGQMGQSVHMMYAAALYWLCGQVLLGVVGLAIAFAIAFPHYCSRRDISRTAHGVVILMTASMIPVSWLASWLFWAGYVKLAGDLYCPPNLVVEGLIWAIFSIVGVFVGSIGVCP
ncbi:hypothetical protein B0H67DRAFT_650048 [Lasiosphaeris hirsuta]|uniref:Uncharacterized protein n=1 Tax=Lasiosphaeris hirsuta TaxID=260670 RepID=A0AA39ZS38_9PEZI|nr:hypothetical protein B0H67DRAFT_650048 [Lasiosphaeris hirsuta]